MDDLNNIHDPHDSIDFSQRKPLFPDKTDLKEIQQTAGRVSQAGKKVFVLTNPDIQQDFKMGYTHRPQEKEKTRSFIENAFQGIKRKLTIREASSLFRESVSFDEQGKMHIQDLEKFQKIKAKLQEFDPLEQSKFRSQLAKKSKTPTIHMFIDSLVDTPSKKKRETIELPQPSHRETIELPSSPIEGDSFDLSQQEERLDVENSLEEMGVVQSEEIIQIEEEEKRGSLKLSNGEEVSVVNETEIELTKEQRIRIRIVDEIYQTEKTFFQSILLACAALVDPKDEKRVNALQELAAFMPKDPRFDEYLQIEIPKEKLFKSETEQKMLGKDYFDKRIDEMLQVLTMSKKFIETQNPEEPDANPFLDSGESKLMKKYTETLLLLPSHYDEMRKNLSAPPNPKTGEKSLNQRMQEIEEKLTSDPKTTQFKDISTLLITFVQRMPRHVLFATELVKLSSDQEKLEQNEIAKNMLAEAANKQNQNVTRREFSSIKRLISSGTLEKEVNDLEMDYEDLLRESYLLLELENQQGELIRSKSKSFIAKNQIIPELEEEIKESRLESSSDELFRIGEDFFDLQEEKKTELKKELESLQERIQQLPKIKEDFDKTDKELQKLLEEFGGEAEVKPLDVQAEIFNLQVKELQVQNEINKINELLLIKEKKISKEENKLAQEERDVQSETERVENEIKRIDNEIKTRNEKIKQEENKIKNDLEILKQKTKINLFLQAQTTLVDLKDVKGLEKLLPKEVERHLDEGLNPETLRKQLKVLQASEENKETVDNLSKEFKTWERKGRVISSFDQYLEGKIGPKTFLFAVARNEKLQEAFSSYLSTGKMGLKEISFYEKKLAGLEEYAKKSKVIPSRVRKTVTELREGLTGRKNALVLEHRETLNSMLQGPKYYESVAFDLKNEESVNNFLDYAMEHIQPSGIGIFTVFGSDQVVSTKEEFGNTLLQNLTDFKKYLDEKEPNHPIREKIEPFIEILLPKVMMHGIKEVEEHKGLDGAVSLIEKENLMMVYILAKYLSSIEKERKGTKGEFSNKISDRITELENEKAHLEILEDSKEKETKIKENEVKRNRLQTVLNQIDPEKRKEITEDPVIKKVFERVQITQEANIAEGEPKEIEKKRKDLRQDFIKQLGLEKELTEIQNQEKILEKKEAEYKRFFSEAKKIKDETVNEWITQIKNGNTDLYNELDKPSILALKEKIEEFNLDTESEDDSVKNLLFIQMKIVLDEEAGDEKIRPIRENITMRKRMAEKAIEEKTVEAMQKAYLQEIEGFYGQKNGVEKLADLMTQKNVDLFSKISFSKAKKPEEFEQLVQLFVDYSNKVSFALVNFVLEAGKDKKEQEKRIRFVVDLGNKLLHAGDIAGYAQVGGACHSSSLSRLFKKDEVKDYDKFSEESSTKLSQTGNFKVMRDLLETRKEKNEFGIPFIAPFTGDYRFGFEGNALENPEGEISWNRFSVIEKTIQNAEEFRNHPEFIQKLKTESEEIITPFDLFPKQIQEKNLYKKSLEVRPR